MHPLSYERSSIGNVPEFPSWKRWKHIGERPAKCKPVWIPCTSQQNFTMYEANGKVTLNINNNMSMVAAFLDIKKAFDTTWHNGLLYKLIILLRGNSVFL
jgi:hypothetical protein